VVRWAEYYAQGDSWRPRLTCDERFGTTTVVSYRVTIYYSIKQYRYVSSYYDGWDLVYDERVRVLTPVEIDLTNPTVTLPVLTPVSNDLSLNLTHSNF